MQPNIGAGIHVVRKPRLQSCRSFFLQLACVVAAANFFAVLSLGSAGTVYITPDGAPAGSCSANVQTPAFFNNASNWGTAANQIGPGTTVLLCGTFTFDANTVGFTVQGNGASGNPITLKFDTSAVLQSPYFKWVGLGACSGNPCGGAIDIYNHSYITVDGQSSGIIQNTANGSSLANQKTSLGVYLSGDHLLVKNLTIKNIYVNTSAEPSSAPGQTTADIRVDNHSTNIEVCGSTLSDARTGIWSSTSASSLSVGPSSCTDTEAASGNNYHHNLISDHCWQISVNGTGYINIYNNEITGYENWYYPLSPHNYHLDGLIVFSDKSVIVTPQIYNNYFHGDFSQSATGFVFCTYGLSGSGSACTAYNNLFVGEGGTAKAGAAFYFHSSDGNPLGPHYIYNNTVIGFAYGIICDGDSTQIYTVKNNIFVSNGQYYYLGQSTPLVNLTSDHNLFFGGRNTGKPGLGAFYWGTAHYDDFAQWQTAGEDAAGKEANPLLDSTNHLQAGSPAIGLGANLTDLNLLSLDTGMPSVVGPAGTSDAIPRLATSAWDAGAFPFGSPNLPEPPTGLTAVPQ